MSYTVTFGTISKRENSTKNSYTSVLSASCLLKESTDALSPTFSLQGQVVSDSLLPCNYMYCSEFGRYYWITSITFYHGVWYVSGEVDVLATYKSDIGNTRALILRAYSLYDIYLPDTKIPFETKPEVEIDADGFGYSSGGTVVVMCAGNDGNDSSTYWAMDVSTWGKLYAMLFTVNFLSDLQSFWNNITQDIINTILDPAQFISNAIWIPINYSDVTGTPENIFIQTYDTTLQGKRVYPNQVMWSGNASISVTHHPQMTDYGYWMDGNLASHRFLNLPGYGRVPLDSDALMQTVNFQVKVDSVMDCLGGTTYTVIMGLMREEYACNLGIPCGFTEMNNNLVGAFGGIASMVTGAVSQNPAMLAAGLNSALHTALPQVERCSQGGSRLMYTKAAQVVSEFYKLPPGITYDTIGKPCGDTLLISSLSGYVLCDSSVSVQCTGTKAEIEKINAYLSGGFYYE